MHLVVCTVDANFMLRRRPDSRASACPGKAANGFRSSSSTLCRRPQRDGGLGCEQQERQRLLEVEAYDAVGVAQIADRNVLPDVQVEIAATRGEHEGTGDGRGPNDLVFDELFDVLQDGIPVIA